MTGTLTYWGRWAALLAALMLVLALVPSTAEASRTPEAGGTVEAEPSPGRVDLSADIRLQDVTVHTVRGLSRDGGCQFSGEDVGGHDPRPVLERSIAFDGATCVMTVERGYVPEGEVSKVQDTGSQAWSGPGTSTATERPATAAPEDETGTGHATPQDELGTGEPAGGPGVAQTHRRQAWHRTWWRDPPGLVVNSVQTNVRYTYNGSCTSNGDYWTNYTWLSGSGWGKQNSNTQSFSGCIGQTTSSYAHFRNGIFCFFIDTHAYYDRTVVSGRANGSYLMSWNTWVSGGCTGLLSFQRTHGWSQIF